jgi:hypothetical protein
VKAQLFVQVTEGGRLVCLVPSIGRNVGHVINDAFYKRHSIRRLPVVVLPSNYGAYMGYFVQVRV